MPLITPLYASLAAFILIVLSLRVIGARRNRRVALGDGADDDLARRIRAHGNFTEFTPLALVLELGGAADSDPARSLSELPPTRFPPS